MEPPEVVATIRPIASSTAMLPPEVFAVTLPLALSIEIDPPDVSRCDFPFDMSNRQTAAGSFDVHIPAAPFHFNAAARRMAPDRAFNFAEMQASARCFGANFAF
jgi:hypothetical protein